MQPHPQAPGHIWPGHLHGAGCLSAGAMDTSYFLLLCGVCIWVWVWPLLRRSQLEFVAYVSGTGFALTPPFLAGDGGVRARVCVFALTRPILAGARGVCAWVPFLP